MRQSIKENIEKNNKKSLMMVIAIMLIVLVVYNVVIFFTFGAKGHGTVFWFSYAVTIIGALSVAVSLALLGPFRAFLRDWLFGFPVVRYGGMYCVMQYTASITFMKTETTMNPKIVYPVQAILLGAYLVLAITCFLTKNNIKQTEEINFDRTIFMKQLRVEISVLPECTENAELKRELEAFAEEAKYSDPVSSEQLEQIEKKLEGEIKECRVALDEKNDAKALELCRTAQRTLKDRNEQCKTFKRNL